jgi:hypothetical protein
VPSNIPNFGSSVEAIPTDSGEAIATSPIPNFGDSKPASEVEIVPVPKQERDSWISKMAQFYWGNTPIGNAEKSIHVLSKLKEAKDEGVPEEELDLKWLNDQAEQFTQEKVAGGLESVLETPMTAAIGMGAVTRPIGTAIGITGYSILDKFINLKRYTDKRWPNSAPEIKDIIVIADFALKVGIMAGAAKGAKKGKNLLFKTGTPKTTNVSPKDIVAIEESKTLTLAEKGDILKTLMISKKKANAAKASGKPVNVKTENVLKLTEKPYWELTKQEFMELKAPAYETIGLTKADLLKSIDSLMKEKGLSKTTRAQLRTEVGVTDLRKANVDQLAKIEKLMLDLKPGDKFFSPKTVEALKDVFKGEELPRVTPKRILIKKFGEKTDILNDAMLSKVDPKLAPTVDIKQGHPLIRKIVDNAKDLLVKGEKTVMDRNQKFDKMLAKAEKSRSKLLPIGERVKRKLVPQNKEIFQALSGEKVKLTPEEAAVVAYAKNFFNMAKKDLALQKYRKNYVTHLEKSYFEKILNDGIINASKSMLRDVATKKKDQVPIDIMLELENIIGSEKFFRFALERKGGVDPTTNLRRVIHSYSNMYEMKLALDQILPEGQAITKNLLKGESAQWMKTFLQNLKGRGMDNSFRTGRMGWLAKTADAAVDLQYIKLLALNKKSPIKNLVAGEANSIIYQDIMTYVKGKQRFWSNPKKAYRMSREYGMLEGTFAEYAQKGIGKLKKLQDLSMIGQRAGEYEIRSSIFVSMLSEAEWKSGKISPRKLTRINDVISKTQGMFSKVDSPLFLQTWYGRALMQMNRWRITNALLLRDISVAAARDVSMKKYNTVNTRRFGKMFLAYGIGMYYGNELRKGGFSAAADIVESMSQTVDGVVSLFSKGELVKMFAQNPTLQMFQEISNTIQNTAVYLKVPGAEPARGKGIEETYIAPKETVEDALLFVDELQ